MKIPPKVSFALSSVWILLLSVLLRTDVSSVQRIFILLNLVLTIVILYFKYLSEPKPEPIDIKEIDKITYQPNQEKEKKESTKKNYDLHNYKVKAICENVKEFSKNCKEGEHFILRKSSVSHMAPQPDNPRHNDSHIDVRKLTTILEIDVDSMTCVAESGVTFDELVRHTIPLGLAPRCVSELKGITIGGAVAGCSVESMSFKYGGFHDSCLEYEIITGKGELIRCSPTTEPELFNSVHGSFGTIAIITLLKFQLVKVKPYVKIDYLTSKTIDGYLETIQKFYDNRNLYSNEEIDQKKQEEKLKDTSLNWTEMMDGLIHQKDQFVLNSANFVDKLPANTKLSEFWVTPYYKTAKNKKCDYMTTYDYFFRYDSDCHWSLRNMPGLENMVLRKLLGRAFLGSSNILKMAGRLPFLVKKGGKPDVIVDVFIPIENVKTFFDWYLETFGEYFPLWIVPYEMPQYQLQNYKHYPWLNPDLMKNLKSSLFIDIAIYGFEQKGKKLNYYHELEKKVLELKGMKTLITHNFYDKDSFWQTFNKPLYRKIKQRSDPKNLLRELYNKTNFKKKK
ncbi:24-dehydrocholesterol reductase [Anaeramoeba flamelloides]|uniref:Delta(24)-sterol reductase n=1 Tax=Anaeramoeba flamelloides TaxID=1746091 RepID=A0AAV7ZHE6_9EUKA|nr:24-dehydrocholesterol reductase [Anaeramoeba flamelloides]KAJ6235280.1 24-dehydrocholesterol reductase [Anaeramoeba flamelloides]